jgi:hypothetical protein
MAKREFSIQPRFLNKNTLFAVAVRDARRKSAIGGGIVRHRDGLDGLN